MFKDLFVLDIANNHFGDASHLNKIINEFGKRIIKHKINACFKFQFRNLDTYIHKDAWQDVDNHYVKRFTSTRLDFRYYKEAIMKIKKLGIKTCCTPFDEFSIGTTPNLAFLVSTSLKIPLIEEIDT